MKDNAQGLIYRYSEVSHKKVIAYSYGFRNMLEPAIVADRITSQNLD
jgi:hypothetical protein